MSILQIKSGSALLGCAGNQQSKRILLYSHREHNATKTQIILFKSSQLETTQPFQLTWYSTSSGQAEERIVCLEV